jgi:hypothetical protein
MQSEIVLVDETSKPSALQKKVQSKQEDIQPKKVF